MHGRSRREAWSRLALAAAATGLVASPAAAERPHVWAIRGGTVVAAPGRTIEGGTVVLRDGLIEAVGAGIAVPPDAVEIDAAERWVYPGLIDADSGLGAGPAEEAGGGSPRGGGRAERESPGAVHPLAMIRPERRARDELEPFTGDRERELERWRELGFTVASLAPGDGVLRGRSVVIQLAAGPVAETILRDDAAQHAGLDRGRFGQGYPTSLMGAIAALRQALLDARRHATWAERWERRPAGLRRPERHAAWEALAPVVAGRQSLVFHLGEPEDERLAEALAREFGLRLVLAGSGHEWEIAERVARSGRALLLPVSFPDKPDVDEAGEALDVSILELRRYLDAPAGAGRLHAAGVRFALVTRGLNNTADFPRNLRKIVEAGLPADAALAALTTVPAAILGLDGALGTLEPGKIANVVVADGPLFAEKTKVREVFVDGVRHEVEVKDKPKGDPDAVVDPRGEWSVVFELGPRTIQRTWTIRGERDRYTGTAETQAGTVDFEEVRLEGNALTVTFPARGGRGAAEVTVIIREDTFEGVAEMGPRSVTVKGTRTSGPPGGGAR